MGGSPKQSQMGGVHAQGKREAAGRPGAGNCRKGTKPYPWGLEIIRLKKFNRNAQKGKTKGSNENGQEVSRVVYLGNGQNHYLTVAFYDRSP